MKPARHVRLSKKRQLSRNAKGKSTFGDLPVGARFALAGKPDDVWTKKDGKTAVCGARVMDAMSRESGVSLRASQTPATTVRFSFADEMDRDNFAAEVEFAFKKRPLRSMIYNATYEARMSNAQDINRVESIARKYYGIEMSLVKPLSLKLAQVDTAMLERALGLLDDGPLSLKKLASAMGVDKTKLLYTLNAGISMRKGLSRSGPNENPVFTAVDADMSHAKPLSRAARYALALSQGTLKSQKAMELGTKDPGGVLKTFKKALGYMRMGPRSLESLVEPTRIDKQTLLNALNAAVRMKIGVARGGPNENPIFRITDIDKAVDAVEDLDSEITE